MPSKFLISFDTPTDADGIVELVVKKDSLRSDSGTQCPTYGPIVRAESPAISIAPPPTAPVAAEMPAAANIIPLVDEITEGGQQVAAFLVEFDEDVELPDGDPLAGNAAEWLDFYGLDVPDDWVTVRAVDRTVIEAVNAPCTTRRFARNATFTLRIRIRPRVSTAPRPSNFTATNATINTVTEVTAGFLYDLAITFPASGTGTSTIVAKNADFDGVSSDITLMTCLYGGSNLQTQNFPTGAVDAESQVTFGLRIEPSLTATPQPRAITLSAGTVNSICEVDGGRYYIVTLTMPSGTGTSTVTANAAGFTNISSNVTLGTISYRPAT